MVPSERDFAINAKVSSEAANRLRKLSVRRGQSYGEVLDALLLEVPIEQAEWEQPLNDALSRITTLENQVSALLSSSTTIANTESLPSLLTVAKQDTSELDEPDLACLTSMDSSALEADLGGSEGRAIVEAGSDVGAAEIAPGAAVDAIEREAAEASILPESPEPELVQGQELPPIREAIAELYRKGKTPQQATDELNRRGYRTKNNTPIQRGWVGNVMKGLGE